MSILIIFNFTVSKYFETCVCSRYKAISKLTFFLNLFLGLVIIALAVFRVDIATLAKSEQAPKLAVFITATLLTFLMGVTTFYNPTQRWRELRDNAETMHSEVFKFRTRTGIYEVSITDTGSAETRFMARIEESIRTAVHSAALTSSSFTRLYSKGVYVHGQNPEGGVLSAFDHSKRVDVERPINTNAPIADDHHSPMKPTQYITARLIPLRDYYNSRVPKIYRERKVMTALLLASTAAISIIAFVGGLTAADANVEAEAGQQFVCDTVGQTCTFIPLEPARNMGLYTTLVAGLASCLTAWQEFKVRLALLCHDLRHLSEHLTHHCGLLTIPPVTGDGPEAQPLLLGDFLDQKLDAVVGQFDFG